MTTLALVRGVSRTGDRVVCLEVRETEARDKSDEDDYHCSKDGFQIKGLIEASGNRDDIDEHGK